MKINIKYNYKEKKRNKNIYFIMSLFVFNFSNYRHIYSLMMLCSEEKEKLLKLT